MREVRGFVFLVNREWGDFLYGRAMNGQDFFCNLVMNGISPFDTQKRAKEAVAAYKSEMNLEPSETVDIMAIEMVIAETKEEIHALATKHRGDMVIISLGGWGENVDENLLGPPAGDIALGSESITTNGFCFYNPEYFKEISKKPFEKEILHRVRELHRQGDMPVRLATIKLEAVDRR